MVRSGDERGVETQEWGVGEGTRGTGLGRGRMSGGCLFGLPRMTPCSDWDREETSVETVPRGHGSPSSDSGNLPDFRYRIWE